MIFVIDWKNLIEWILMDVDISFQVDFSNPPLAISFK